MRLTPIEKPATLLSKIAYRSSKRRLGKVITPLKVVYARVPKSLKSAYAISKFTESGFSLDAELRFLIQTHVASINDCAFCVDIAKAIATHQGIGLDKCLALPEYAASPLFTERERAALAYAEEATRNKRVGDPTFARLQEHFNDREIVEITLLNAIENYYNLINLPLEIESDGLCAIVAPGRPAKHVAVGK